MNRSPSDAECDCTAAFFAQDTFTLNVHMGVCVCVCVCVRVCMHACGDTCKCMNGLGVYVMSGNST